MNTTTARTLVVVMLFCCAAAVAQDSTRWGYVTLYYDGFEQNRSGYISITSDVVELPFESHTQFTQDLTSAATAWLRRHSMEYLGEPWFMWLLPRPAGPFTSLEEAEIFQRERTLGEFVDFSQAELPLLGGFKEMPDVRWLRHHWGGLMSPSHTGNYGEDRGLFRPSEWTPPAGSVDPRDLFMDAVADYEDGDFGTSLAKFVHLREVLGNTNARIQPYIVLTLAEAGAGADIILQEVDIYRSVVADASGDTFRAIMAISDDANRAVSRSWNSAQSANNPDALRTHLSSFPSSPYRSAAVSRIDELERNHLARFETSGLVSDADRYLNAFPGGSLNEEFQATLVSTMEQSLSSGDWRSANAIAGWASEARALRQTAEREELIERITEERFHAEVMDRSDVSLCVEFLERYPGSRHAARVQGHVQFLLAHWNLRLLATTREDVAETRRLTRSTRVTNHERGYIDSLFMEALDAYELCFSSEMLSSLVDIGALRDDYADMDRLFARLFDRDRRTSASRAAVSNGQAAPAAPPRIPRQPTYNVGVPPVVVLGVGAAFGTGSIGSEVFGLEAMAGIGGARFLLGFGGGVYFPPSPFSSSSVLSGTIFSGGELEAAPNSSGGTFTTGEYYASPVDDGRLHARGEMAFQLAASYYLRVGRVLLAGIDAGVDVLSSPLFQVEIRRKVDSSSAGTYYAFLANTLVTTQIGAHLAVLLFSEQEQNLFIDLGLRVPLSVAVRYQIADVELSFPWDQHSPWERREVTVQIGVGLPFF